MPSKQIFLFTAINILNYLDRYLVAGVLLSVQKEFGLSNANAGWLFAAFVPGYVIFSPIFGYLGDRYKRPQLMAFGVFLWSLASIATGLAPGFWTFVCARVLVGIGEASYATIAPGYLKDVLKDPIKLNSALALFYAAVPIGTALAYVTGGYSAQYFSWQVVFFVAGAPGLFMAVLLWRFDEVRGETVASESLLSGLKEIAKVKLLWLVIIGYILNNFALTGIAAFVAAHGESLGFSKSGIGLWFGLILLIAGGGGTLLGGRLASRLAKNYQNPVRCMLLYVGISALLGVPFVFWGFGASGHYNFLMLCFMAEIFVFAGVAPINSIIVLICPPALVTLTQGVAILALNIFGSLPAPILVGHLADSYGLGRALQILSVFLFLSGTVWTIAALRSRMDDSK